jgi:hypothetical protein
MSSKLERKSSALRHTNKIQEGKTKSILALSWQIPRKDSLQERLRRFAFLYLLKLDSPEIIWKSQPREQKIMHHFASKSSLFFFRSSPKTLWRCLSMLSCTTACPMPPYPWQTSRTLTTLPGCWHRPRWETFWVQRTYTKFSVTERASLDQCRYGNKNSIHFLATWYLEGLNKNLLRNFPSARKY